MTNQQNIGNSAERTFIETNNFDELMADQIIKSNGKLSEPVSTILNRHQLEGDTAHTVSAQMRAGAGNYTSNVGMTLTIFTDENKEARGALLYVNREKDEAIVGVHIPREAFEANPELASAIGKGIGDPDALKQIAEGVSAKMEEFVDSAKQKGFDMGMRLSTAQYGGGEPITTSSFKPTIQP